MFNLTQSEKNKSLKQALEQADVKKVEKALQGGADPNSVGEHGAIVWTIYNIGGSKGNELVKLLLENGASPDASSDKSLVPMMVALEREKYTILDELIKAKPDFNVRDSYGRTVFHLAVKNGWVSVIHDLINAGGATASMDSQNNTPLMYALKRKLDPGVITKIASEKSGLDVYKGHDENPLTIAITQENKDVFDVLIEQHGIAPYNHKMGMNNQNLLHLAVEKEFSHAILPLIKAGVDINGRDANRRTPFMQAARQCSFPMVMKFLNAAKERNITLPWAAAIDEALQSTEGFAHNIVSNIAPMLTVEEQNKRHGADGQTYLTKAVTLNNDRLVRAYLKAGLDPHATNAAGQTPYMIALEAKNVMMIDILSEYRLPEEPEYVPPPPPPRVSDLCYKRINDYAIEVSDKTYSLSMVFNFWTQQVTHRDVKTGHIVVQNFDDMQREEAIIDAREHLLKLDGFPPEMPPRNEKPDAPKFQRKQANNP